MFRTLGILLLTLALASCASRPDLDFDVRNQNIQYKDLTTINSPEGEPIIIAVYDFADMTGQKKPSDSVASMSTAVTQGSYQLLIKALQDAGNGEWFRVVERTSLPSLLQERKLIRSTRQQVNGEGAEPLPPLLFAGAYITGGIVGYDSNTKTGGIGARVLGIQTHKQWRQDIITIILRLVNVQTGEVVISTTVEKTIISAETGGDVFKYFDADTLLVEIEAGVSRNEPVTYAVRKAIEKGVVDLINQGAEKDLWQFAVEETPEIKDYVDPVLNIEVGDEKVEKTYEMYLEEKKIRKENDLADKEIIKKAEDEAWNQIEETIDEEQDEKTNNDSGDSVHPSK
tara:strand:- start:730 stop:1755 length:1026 start_codon:yes stop_codon:yes gene_type:complete